MAKNNKANQSEAETKSKKTLKETLLDMLANPKMDLNEIDSFLRNNPGINVSQFVLDEFFTGKRRQFKNTDTFDTMIKNMQRCDKELGKKMIDGFMQGAVDSKGHNPATFLADQVKIEKKLANNIKQNRAEYTNPDRDIGIATKRADSALKMLNILKKNGVDLSMIDTQDLATESEARQAQATNPSDSRENRGEGEEPTEDSKENGVEVGSAENPEDAMHITEKDTPPVTVKEDEAEKTANVAQEGEDKGKSYDSGNWRDIREKDIIDYIYDDIFIYYLNKGMKKLNDWALGRIDNWAESTSARSAEIKKAAAAEKDENLKNAMTYCGNALDMKNIVNEASSEEARAQRLGETNAIINEIRENAGKPKDERIWEHITDEKDIKKLNKQIDKNPEKVLDSLDTYDNLKDVILQRDEIILKLALAEGHMKYTSECLDEGNYDFLKTDINEGADKHINLAYQDIREKYDNLMLQAEAVAGMKGLNLEESNKLKELYATQFVENYIQYLDNSHKALSEEVKEGQFKANNGKARTHDGRKTVKHSPELDTLVNPNDKEVLQLLGIRTEGEKDGYKKDLKEAAKAAKDAQKANKKYEKKPSNLAEKIAENEARKRTIEQWKTIKKTRGGSANNGNTGSNNGQVFGNTGRGGGQGR